MQQNATQQTQHNGSHHNATQCNTTQQNSPQNNKTGNKNRAHVLDKPVEVTSSSTRHSTEKKTVKNTASITDEAALLSHMVG